MELHNLATKEVVKVIPLQLLSNDVFSDFTHVFLVPDEGYSRIIKLHDRLYTGMLIDELRLDIPFIPHIGIANSRNAQECKNLVDNLNSKSFEVNGKVETLDVIWYEGNQVDTIKKISLM
ncbi:MAG: 2'-5' RNA ligase family protein [Elainellaceae cyanobacterium]